MIYSITTQTPLQTVKDAINSNAKEYGFGVLGSYEFKKILDSKGFSLEKDVTVYEVCNPKGGHDALSQIPEISAFLPCRLSVFEDGENTTISTIDVSVILGCVNANPQLQGHMNAIYENLVKLMRSL